MAEPTLNEIINVHADPERGTGTPAVAVPESTNLLNILNKNFEMRARQDQLKYAQFQENLQNVYQNVDDVMAYDMAPGDREALTKEAADIFSEIAKDPRALFGSGNIAKMTELQKRVGALKSKATQSKQDHIFDNANRKFIEENPNMNNKANRQMIESFLNQPLGARKPYLLQTPGMYDPEKLAKGISELSKQPFSTSQFTQDGSFIQTTTGERYDPEKYNQVAELMYDTPGPNGEIMANTIRERFAELPDYIQKKYKGDDPAKQWYMETMSGLRPKDNISKQDIKANPFALEIQKAKDKLAEQKQKHGFDIDLEREKTKGRKEVEDHKNEAKSKSAKQNYQWLHNFTQGTLDDALANNHGLVFEVDKATGERKPMYKLNVSNPILDIFGYNTTEGINKTRETPDEMYTDVKQEQVTARYYKKNSDKSIKKDKEGNPIVDLDKSKTFSRDQFESLLGKGLLGVAGSIKSLNAPEINPPKSKSLVLGGQKYTENQLKKMGYSDEEIQAGIDQGIITTDDGDGDGDNSDNN